MLSKPLLFCRYLSIYMTATTNVRRRNRFLHRYGSYVTTTKKNAAPLITPSLPAKVRIIPGNAQAK